MERPRKAQSGYYSWPQKTIIYSTISYHLINYLRPKISVSMNLHEYQAKELLKKFNVPVQEGIACATVHEAEEAYRR